MTDLQPLPTPDPDPPIDARLVSANLSSLGLSPDTIAATLNLPVHTIREYLTTRVVTHEEEILAEKVRRLTDLALSKAFLILEHGPTEQKMVIIRSLVTNTGRLIGRGEGGSTEEARAAFESLLTQMRDVPRVTTLVTDEDIIDVEEDDADSAPPHRTTLNQDEEAGDETLRFGLR